jgi:curved DNA-binding protein CbpA
MKWKERRTSYQSLLEEWKSKSPREILGVSEAASGEEIKRRYRQLVRLYHPDHSDLFLRATREEILKYINRAYAGLTGRLDER